MYNTVYTHHIMQFAHITAVAMVVKKDFELYFSLN